MMMAVAILAFTFTGCSDEATPESDDKILKPVAENVIGKWSMKESYKSWMASGWKIPSPKVRDKPILSARTAQC